MKKLLLSLFLAQFAFNFTFAQLAPGVHVDGNYLKDDAGNKVVLHGYMDTPNPYFNGYRWGNSLNVSAAKAYFKGLFWATTNPSKGTYCNIFRLHLDPCWTNDPNKQSTGTESGEANISRFSQTRLKSYMKFLFFPIAYDAMNHGMHVIMRPPGVCPGDIYVDGEYQKYLINVWDEVTKNDSILKYYKHISLELANEPVRIKNAAGVEKDENLRDFFQPVIDKIRANGFKGIIWVPGTGWQASYSAYAKYPVKDPLHNLGFAVHNYNGWYSNDETNYKNATNKTEYIKNAIAQFGRQVPVVRTNPIVITEVDWSPNNPGTGHYDEHGKWVESNYGTWATATTSNWGKGYKATLDYYENISMTLSGCATYLNIDTYTATKAAKNDDDIVVQPAFTGVEEASGETCWKWYKEYAQVNYPSNERYQPVQVVPENPLSLEEGWFNPTLLYENTIKRGSSFAQIAFEKDGGCAGWRYEEPVDYSEYETLTVKLKIAPTYITHIRIYDTHDFWGDYAEVKITKKETVISLADLKTVEGNDLNLKNIRLVYFTSAKAGALNIVGCELAKITTGIANVNSSANDDVKYDIVGRIIKNTPKGFYIQNGKKFFNK